MKEAFIKYAGSLFELGTCDEIMAMLDEHRTYLNLLSSRHYEVTNDGRRALDAAVEYLVWRRDEAGETFEARTVAEWISFSSLTKLLDDENLKTVVAKTRLYFDGLSNGDSLKLTDENICLLISENFLEDVTSNIYSVPANKLMKDILSVLVWEKEHLDSSLTLEKIKKSLDIDTLMALSLDKAVDFKLRKPLRNYLQVLYPEKVGVRVLDRKLSSFHDSMVARLELAIEKIQNDSAHQAVEKPSENEIKARHAENTACVSKALMSLGKSIDDTYLNY